MLFFVLFLLLTSVPAAAETTRAWEQTRFDEFERGAAEHIAIRSDGKLALAPRFQEIYDAPLAYLWALARDSRGNLFAAGGPGGRVLKLGSQRPGAKDAKPFFETEALEIHALAVDRNDNVYAATSPDSKIYKIETSGRSSLFLDAKVKYIWAMAFNSRGDLFLATGDKGEVLRVTPAGQSSVFFRSDESHIRSMVIARNDDVLIGTDPAGLVIRIPAAGGQGFVLYQSAKKEITALALAADGSLYAAAVGARTRSTTPPPPPAPAPQPTPAPIAATLTAQGTPPAPALQPAPLPSTIRTGVSGGSEVFRIGADGAPRRLWTSNDDVVYTLGFGPQQKLLVGTGNQGRIYQLESDQVYSLLLKAAPSQVTTFLPGPEGQLYAATGNIGKVYRLGPELEPKGSFESEVFDAGLFSRWGRLSWKGVVPQSAGVTLYARSGNLSTPAQYWSPWSKPITTPEGAVIDSPPARFVQWKAVLETRASASPLLDSVTLVYQPKNVAPIISELEITPSNYKFPEPPATPLPPSQNLSLPALGSKPSHTGPTGPQPARSMVHAKGYLGARWAAQDENEDDLVYKIEIRGAGEQSWKLLREKLEQPQLSFDSTAFADGLYLIRVTVSDAPSNPGPEALSYSRESDPFYIDNTPPAISALAGTADGGRLRVRFHAADSLTNIDRAEYSVDGHEWLAMQPATRLFDSRDLDFDFLTGDVKPGEHTVAIRAWDENDNLATAKVVVR